MTTKPQSKERVFVASVVLKPWKSIRDAMTVAVEKPTKYMGFTLRRTSVQNMS